MIKNDQGLSPREEEILQRKLEEANSKLPDITLISVLAHQMYCSFKDQTFTDDQALELTKSLLPMVIQ